MCTCRCLHPARNIHQGFSYCAIKERVSFFLGSLGMNRSAGQTNRVNREAVLGRFVCSALRFIPHEHRKKTLIPYICNASNQGPFLKFSEKNYKFKIPKSYGLLTSFDALITAHVIRSNCRTFCWLCSSGNELKNFKQGSTKEICYHCKYYAMNMNKQSAERVPLRVNNWIAAIKLTIVLDNWTFINLKLFSLWYM